VIQSNNLASLKLYFSLLLIRVWESNLPI
jgi:hypothetical protein